MSSGETVFEISGGGGGVEPLPLTVFLVEHDPAVRDSLAVSLEAAGLVVKAYESVKAFLAGFEPIEPACLVLDLDSAEPDGLSMARRFADHRVELPIIATSGRLAASFRHRHAVMKGPLLQKPFGDVELIALIEQAVMDAAGRGPVVASSSGSRA